MKRSQHVLAAVMLATALCADRVGAPAWTAGPQMAQVVRRLTDRLTLSLRQVVPVARLHIGRRPAGPAVIPSATLRAPEVPVAARPWSPFQFRMPPPLC